MRTNARVTIVLGGLACVAVGWACTGDDPIVGADPGDGGTTVIVVNNNDATSGDDSGNGGDAGDAQLVCDDPTVACDGKCVTLTESKLHCGRCGHSCGGGECDKGTCKAVGVVSNIQELGGMSVSLGYIYYATNNQDQSSTTLIRCTVAGCQPAETLFSSNILASNIESVIASKDAVSFIYTRTSAFENVYVCAGAGCPTDGGSPAVGGPNAALFAGANKKFFWTGGKFSTSVLYADCTTFPASPCVTHSFGAATGGYAGDDTHVVYSRDDGGVGELVYCDLPGCDAGAVFMTNEIPEQATIYNGVLYSMSAGITGQATGKIRKCTLPCAGGFSDFVGPLNYPTDFLVDSSGLYWISPNLDQIRHCPLAGNCGGGDIVITGLGTGARMLRTDDGFVYWASDATTDGAPFANITRIAKP